MFTADKKLRSPTMWLPKTVLHHLKWILTVHEYVRLNEPQGPLIVSRPAHMD